MKSLVDETDAKFIHILQTIVLIIGIGQRILLTNRRPPRLLGCCFEGPSVKRSENIPHNLSSLLILHHKTPGVWEVDIRQCPYEAWELAVCVFFFGGYSCVSSEEADV